MPTTTMFDAACHAGTPGHELSDKAPHPLPAATCLERTRPCRQVFVQP